MRRHDAILVVDVSSDARGSQGGSHDALVHVALRVQVAVHDPGGGQSRDEACPPFRVGQIRIFKDLSDQLGVLFICLAQQFFRVQIAAFLAEAVAAVRAAP